AGGRPSATDGPDSWSGPCGRTGSSSETFRVLLIELGLRRLAATPSRGLHTPVLRWSLPQIAQEMPNREKIRKSLTHHGLRGDAPGRFCQRYCVADEIALAGGNGCCRVWDMEATTDNLVPADREGLVWLAQLLLELAQERSLDGVLRKAMDAAA